MDLVQESMNKFVEDLMKHNNWSNLDKEVIDQMKTDLMERLEDRINAAILSKMPEDKLDEFNKLLDSGTDDELQDFIKANISDLENVIATELINFQKLYIS